MFGFNSKIKNFWERLNQNIRGIESWDSYISQIYHTFKPPSRPSLDDQKNYKKCIDSLGGDGRVVILGVTPSIRQQLSGFGGEIYVADYSRAMYEAANKMLEPEIISKEKYYRIDWLNLNKIFNKGSVDFVVGDLVFTQISPNLRRKFLEIVQYILRPGGLFVARIKIFNPLWKNASVIEILRMDLEHASLQEKLYGTYLPYRLGDKILDLDTQSFDTSDCLRHLYQAHTEVLRGNEAEHYYLHRWINYYQKFRMIRTHFLKDRAESLFKEFFTIDDCLLAGDYPEPESFPIYALKRPLLN